jgi:hypothetical protein
MKDELAETKPNSNAIGRSGSVQSDAMYVNAVVNSMPLIGEIRKVPGCGGPLVTTVTDDSACSPEASLQTRENVRVTLSGSE